MGMTSMGGGGQRITPNDLAIIDELQGLARSPQGRAVPAPIENRSMGVDNFGRPVMADPTQRPPDYTRPQGIGERLTGILGGIGRGVNEYLADDENRARLVMALNSMRLQPDAGLSSAMGRQIETAQALRLMNSQGNRTAAAIRQIGGPKAEQYARAIEQNPSLAKEYFSAFIKESQEPTYRTMSGTELNEQMPGSSFDPTRMYSVPVVGGILDSRNPIKPIGGQGVEVNLPGDSRVLQDAANDALVQAVETGAGAKRQSFYLDQVSNLLAGGMATGPKAAFVADLRQRAAAIGFPINENDLSDTQRLAGLTARLVAEELRLNKGPQTDFDAMYAATYYPNIGLTAEANERMLRDYRSLNALSSTIGEVAAGRKMTFEGEGNDLLLSQRINRYRTTLGSAVRVEHDPSNPSNDKYALFSDFEEAARQEGKTAVQILDEWGALHDEMRRQERALRLSL